eukprot:scaffold21582_cov97-Isochrysis_galbana.AAC.5
MSEPNGGGSAMYRTSPRPAESANGNKTTMRRTVSWPSEPSLARERSRRGDQPARESRRAENKMDSASGTPVQMSSASIDTLLLAADIASPGGRGSRQETGSR